MKRFVRVLGWIFLSLGLIALAIILFFSYRQMRSESQWVHRDATAIVEVKSDRIFRELAANALWNPSAYFGSERDTLADTVLQKLRPWNLGVSLPANVYFFSLPSGESSYFTILPVDDLPRLQQVLSTALNTSLNVENSSNWCGRTEDKSLYVVGNERYVVLGWNPSKTDTIVEPMQQMLASQDDFIEIATLKAGKPKEATGDIVFWKPGEASFWSMDFRAGEIVIAGLLGDADWRFSNKPVGAIFPENNILSVRLLADIRPWLAKHEDMLQAQGLPWKDIEPYLGNYWELQWKNEAVLQADTIITYDYDDNFEMVEKRELRNETVPDLTLSFMASPHLLSYLPEKLFYKFYKKQAGQLLILSTNNARPAQGQELVPQTDLLYVRYQQPEIWNAPIPMPTWLQKIERADIAGTQGAEQTINVSGTFEFTNGNLHPLKHLLSPKR
ncbi:hypothetical protein M8998_05055 [Sphingobacterium sp. lm-10]|uniref:hypothetical protein n=1 Tax=Sphingobacterium sp. lm-10 TaxID=2944904 RepID=UPI00201FD347|nr:hypothetical protein [Sphingobacterium sp. lm-10]MCL7987307.1 hypothetical protein [Sphingobacterium sp. lm-10]